MNAQPHVRALAQKLATKFREIESTRQIGVVDEWRKTVDELTQAMKKARRAVAERHRVAAVEGRMRTLSYPG